MINESVAIDSKPDVLSDYSLQVNRLLLKPIGAWPLSSSSSKLEKIISVVLILVCYCSISFTVIPCILHLILDDDNVRVKLKVVGPLSHWFNGGANYTSLLLSSDKIYRCMEHVRADWRIISRLKDRKLMLKYSQFGRYVAAIAAVCMQGGVSSYCLVLALTRVTVYVNNKTSTVHPVPCPPYSKLIDIETSPTNEIVLISQFLSCFIVNSITVGFFSLSAVLASHACGQLEVLMAWITEFVNESKGNKEFRNEIGMIVEQHLRIFSFISNIEAVMNRICFMEMLKSTLDICMLSYYLLTEWADHDFKTLSTYIIIFISMCFNIFIVCYIGEVLSEQCKKVGEVVYMTNWYCLPHETVLDLILIIARSSVVTKITAGKLVQMSVHTFGDCKKVGEKAYMTDWYLLPHKTALALVLIISRSSVVIKITAGKFMPVSIATFGDVFKASFAYFNMLRTTVL